MTEIIENAGIYNPEKVNYHQWSGWPASFCLKCGRDDLMEYAIGNGLYDPVKNEWVPGNNPDDYDNGECPFTELVGEKKP